MPVLSLGCIRFIPFNWIPIYIVRIEDTGHLHANQFTTSEACISWPRPGRDCRRTLDDLAPLSYDNITPIPDFPSSRTHSVVASWKLGFRSDSRRGRLLRSLVRWSEAESVVWSRGIE